MKITVVGCGKIGCTVINALLSEGHEIVAIDNDPDVICYDGVRQRNGFGRTA